MSKIIEIKDLIEKEKKKELDLKRKRLIEGIQKFLLCSNCRMKCSRCGTQVDISISCPYPFEIPFRLCVHCAEEYREYQHSIIGIKSSNIPWHNQEWKEMWSAWIEYRKALVKFQNSKEVRDLFDDLKK